mmetsp:Transcript_13050/g.19538  ORF Transcript_13050/g.19538 Transcript_13050/m.19538 type:complete len:236 (+) Transcript_13050:184-891(+)
MTRKRHASAMEDEDLSESLFFQPVFAESSTTASVFSNSQGSKIQRVSQGNEYQYHSDRKIHSITAPSKNVLANPAPSLPLENVDHWINSPRLGSLKEEKKTKKKFSIGTPTFQAKTPTSLPSSFLRKKFSLTEAEENHSHPPFIGAKDWNHLKTLLHEDLRIGIFIIRVGYKNVRHSMWWSPILRKIVDLPERKEGNRFFGLDTYMGFVHKEDYKPVITGFRRAIREGRPFENVG